ncbi:MAG TPA: 1-acyl-sn-glycerol-3-phosphate acyltransferase, partial [Microthrixaceae bacterium]|nr:1-acyl-sn-glycerol-3-phosphate acyltransferase [Microthrixaceae bacterium]
MTSTEGRDTTDGTTVDADLAELASAIDPPARASTRALVPVPAPESDEDDEHVDVRLSDVDEWGRSERMRALARRLYDPMYRRWFRTEWEGLEKIPAEGGALLVANHAGAIPSDAPVIMHGIEEELKRPVYGLADNLFRTIPVVGTLWSRVGGVPAHPDNAYRLLSEQGQLVLDFPEGVKGPAKTINERYQ